MDHNSLQMWKAKLQEAQQPVPDAQQPVVNARQQPVPSKKELQEPGVEVLKSPSARGSKRPHPPTPVKPLQAAQKKAPSEQDEDDEDEPPKVMSFSSMTKLEKEKVRRIVTPKKGSGNLEVPENIFEMWKDAGKGRDNLFRMWAKSGGVKARAQRL